MEGHIQTKVKEGASPLRVYTHAVATQVLTENVLMQGPVCDLGCGSGGQSRLFEAAGRNSLYVGIDIARHPCWASQVSSAHSRQFVQMTAEDLGLASDSLAFTFSSSALEHVPDIRRTIGELARAMRPNAYGLHIVPGVWSLILYLFHGYRRFSAGGLVDLFQRAGLQVERVWSLGGIPSFLLHALWITGVETILVQRVLHLKVQLRKGRVLRFYSWLLTWALRMDPFLPFAPAGYAVLVRKL
jgi:SAM-dependent methyltransferase